MAKQGMSGSRRTYDNTYFDRSVKVQSLGDVPGDPDDPIVAAMGFTLAHPEIHTAIIGTKNPRHVVSNIETLDDALNIDPKFVDAMHDRFAELDVDWRQLTYALIFTVSTSSSCCKIRDVNTSPPFLAAFVETMSA